MAQEIGLGVIGMNPHNMGSTMTLVTEQPDLRYEIRGICARNAEVLEEYAGQIGVDFWTTDYQELVQRPDIEVVTIYSPDHLHAEHAIAALEAGKHVVCTKPMVNNLEDAKKLVQLVRDTGLKFLVGQTMRFDREFLAIRRMVEDGDLGELIFADAYYVHDLRPIFEFTPWRLEVPQDFMYGGVVHPLDILRCFMGDVAEVHAYGIKGGMTPKYPIEDNFILNLKFASGKIGRAMGLYGIVHPPIPMMMVSLYGNQGTAIGDFTDNEPGHLRVVLDKLGTQQPLEQFYPPERDTSVYGHGQTVIRYMRHFQECLDQDLEPSPNVVDGAKAIAVGHAAWESIHTGQPVAVFNEFE